MNKTCSTLIHQVETILTYNESLSDIYINYFLILVTFTTLLTIPSSMNSPYYKYYLIISTLFLIMYQITLCLIVGCVGVSIVWSAYSGMSYCLLLHNDKYKIVNFQFQHKFLIYIQFMIVILTWLYYYFMEEIITSIAHILAFLLGMGIHYIYYFNYLTTTGSNYVEVHS
jgi:hypothetical protein